MSTERPTLAEALEQHMGCGPEFVDEQYGNICTSSGHNWARNNGGCEFADAMADAARQWFLDLLTDETLTERAAFADFLGWCDHDDSDEWLDLPETFKAGHRDAARAVLAVVAEAVREE